jgi:hypothetical protein
MSSIEMPLATREPTNGGTKIRLSTATSERAALGDGAVGRHGAEIGVEVPGPLALHQRLDGAQTFERVLAVEDAAVVHRAQVVLDVVAGECGPAEQHRDAFEAAVVHLEQVLAHDKSALHEQAAHADGVGLGAHRGLDEVVDRHLDAEVVHRVAVVRQDDVDEVLADVVHVAFDRPEDDRALAGAVDPLHVRLEVGDRRLHRLRALQHERELHLAARKQLADHLHAAQQHVVHDAQRVHRLELLVEIGLDAVALTVDDPVLQPLGDGPARAVLALDRARVDVLEQGHELLERVVAVAAPVVDQVERNGARMLVDLVHRHDPRRVHDCRVEPGFTALVQEDAVEHVPGRRLQTERDVREPEDRRDAGKLGLDAADRLDRLHAVAAEVLRAGAEGERERVEDEVGAVDPVLLRRDVVDAVRDAQLPVGVASLTFLVDREADDGRAVLAREGEDPVHPLALALALLEVRRVQQRLASVVLEAGFQHARLGRVEHEGE